MHLFPKVAGLVGCLGGRGGSDNFQRRRPVGMWTSLPGGLGGDCLPKVDLFRKVAGSVGDLGGEGLSGVASYDLHTSGVVSYNQPTLLKRAVPKRPRARSISYANTCNL